MESSTPPFGVAAAFRGTGQPDDTNESVHIPSASTAHAKPLQIIKFDQESDGEDPLKVVCHKEALKSIVDKTGDRPIVVLAIAGPMRQGKSFYLNFILRRLHGTTNESEPLNGFKWRGNNDPVTDGIWMWSEPFTLKSQLDGSPFDLLLMDTQGVFDENTGDREWCILIGLTLLTSSCFLYNAVNNVNDKDLQLLNEFLSFSEMALQFQDPNYEGERKPFQNLVFLVRDWNRPSQFPYGSEGGQKFIQNKLKKKDTHQKDNSLVRDQLEKRFHDISCILLPHPGQDVLLRDGYSESVAGSCPFEKDFNDSVDDILFRGNKLPSKTVNGKILNGQDIFDLFTSYTKLFNEDDFLTSESIYYAQAKACNAAVVNTCISSFVSRIKIKLEEVPVLLDADLDQIWKDERQRALTQFEKSKKMGSRRLIDEADNDLCDHLTSVFSQLKSGYITKRQQNISNAQNMAIQQYETIMESIGISNEFLSNEDLQRKSNSAQVEAISLFCSFLKLKKSDDLASEKETISVWVKSKFQDLCIRNDSKRAEAEDLMRQESRMFQQSYFEQMQAKINCQILSQEKLGKYHAKLASSITQEFTRKHSESPLLTSTLQLLSEKIEAEYKNLQIAMSTQKMEAVQNAKEHSFKAVVQYRQKMIAENPKEYSQFQNLHSATKKSLFEDLMNSQAAEIPTELMLTEIWPQFESQIGQVHAEFLAAFHKKLAQSQREMEVAKKEARAEYKKQMKSLISDQNSVLTDQELKKEHGSRWKKAIQLLDLSLQQNCLPLNDNEIQSAKDDLLNSITQVFTKILHKNAEKRKQAEQGTGAYIEILSKEYAGELKSSLADNGVQVAINKNNESLDESFSHCKNKMFEVPVSGCEKEKDNFESAHLSVSEVALNILQQSATTASNQLFDKSTTIPKNEPVPTSMPLPKYDPVPRKNPTPSYQPKFSYEPAPPKMKVPTPQPIPSQQIPSNSKVNEVKSRKPTNTKPYGLGIFISQDTIHIGIYKNNYETPINYTQSPFITLKNDGIEYFKKEELSSQNFNIIKILKDAQIVSQSLLISNQTISLRAEEIVGLFFQKLKSKAASVVEIEDFKSCVVAVSALWGLSSKQMLKNSLLLAGFEKCQLIQTATSIGLAYLLKSWIQSDHYVALVHQHSSGFNVALAQVSSSALVVKRIYANESLEGASSWSWIPPVSSFYKLFSKTQDKISYSDEVKFGKIVSSMLTALGLKEKHLKQIIFTTTKAMSQNQKILIKEIFKLSDLKFVGEEESIVLGAAVLSARCNGNFAIKSIEYKEVFPYTIITKINEVGSQILVRRNTPLDITKRRFPAADGNNNNSNTLSIYELSGPGGREETLIGKYFMDMYNSTMGRRKFEVNLTSAEGLIEVNLEKMDHSSPAMLRIQTNFMTPSQLQDATANMPSILRLINGNLN